MTRANPKFSKAMQRTFWERKLRDVFRSFYEKMGEKIFVDGVTVDNLVASGLFRDPPDLGDFIAKDKVNLIWKNGRIVFFCRTLRRHAVDVKAEKQEEEIVSAVGLVLRMAYGDVLDGDRMFRIDDERLVSWEYYRGCSLNRHTRYMPFAAICQFATFHLHRWLKQDEGDPSLYYFIAEDVAEWDEQILCRLIEEDRPHDFGIHKIEDDAEEMLEPANTDSYALDSQAVARFFNGVSFGRGLYVYLCTGGGDFSSESLKRFIGDGRAIASNKEWNNLVRVLAPAGVLLGFPNPLNSKSLAYRWFNPPYEYRMALEEFAGGASLKETLVHWA